jgi:hypothetical protein
LARRIAEPEMDLRRIWRSRATLAKIRGPTFLLSAKSISEFKIVLVHLPAPLAPEGADGGRPDRSSCTRPDLTQMRPTSSGRPGRAARESPRRRFSSATSAVRRRAANPPSATSTSPEALHGKDYQRVPEDHSEVKAPMYFYQFWPNEANSGGINPGPALGQRHKSAEPLIVVNPHQH